MSIVAGFGCALAVIFPALAPSPAIPSPNAANNAPVDTLLHILFLSSSALIC
jgi:hypothetical protein